MLLAEVYQFQLLAADCTNYTDGSIGETKAVSTLIRIFSLRCSEFILIRLSILAKLNGLKRSLFQIKTVKFNNFAQTGCSIAFR
jgi:hypothetical protein